MRSPPNRALALVGPRGWSRRQWSDVAFVTMMTIGWAAGNLLAVLGCVVAGFLVIAHGDFSVFMSHIDNVASRYVAADMGRRAGFEHEVVLALAVCAAVFFLIRLPRFVMRLRLELAQERRNEG